MSNSEKAVEVIFATEKRIQGHAYDLDEARVRAYAQALADAGLLAPELPEPDRKLTERWGEKDLEFAYWEIPYAARVETSRGWEVSLRIPDRYMSTETARKLANILLAAANHAEGEA